MQTKRSGSLFMVETECTASQVSVVQHSFHPAFLQDLQSVRNANDTKEMMDQYGTHFIRNAVMGGRLRQLTSIESNFESSKTSREITEHAEIAFTASISAPVFTASGSYAESTDSSTSEAAQGEFLNESTRSKLLIYGGTPGSFGPSSQVDTNYGDWATNVDLRPVPISYELEPIANIIPPTWKNANGESIQQMWLAGELLWIADKFRNTAPAVIADEATQAKPKATHAYYTVVWAWDRHVPAPVDNKNRVVVTLTDLENPSNIYRSIIFENRGPAGTSIPVTFHKVDQSIRFPLWHGFTGPNYNQFRFTIDFESSSNNPHNSEFARTTYAGIVKSGTRSWVWHPSYLLPHARYYVDGTDLNSYYVGFNTKADVTGYDFSHFLCSDPDRITVTINGQRGSISEVYSLSNENDHINHWTWGFSGELRSPFYRVPSGGRYIGPITSISLTVGNDVACHKTLNTRDPGWTINGLFAIGPECKTASCDPSGGFFTMFYYSYESHALRRFNPVSFNTNAG
jgi:hypothetical protein